MSLGARVLLPVAQDLAIRLAAELAPLCTRVKVAGSVRRERPVVSDLELVIAPRLLPSDLFGNPGAPDIAPIRRLAESWGRIKRGGERLIGITEACGSKLDVELYMVHRPAQFAVIWAIRTGPAELSQRAVTLMHGNGCRSEHGRIIDIKTGAVIPCPDEETFFRLAGLRCLPPRFRDGARAQAQVGVHA